MPIYTKTGDRGETSLFGGRRIGKSDIQVETYGTIDELSSFIGLTHSEISQEHDKIFLTGIQEDLWKIMGVLSSAKQDLSYLEKRIEAFEKKIDELDRTLPKLTRFILPGGTKNAALFHVCRTVCRRAERRVVILSTNRKIQSIDLIIKYLNRLSDLFFMFARKYSEGKEATT